MIHPCFLDNGYMHFKTCTVIFKTSTVLNSIKTLWKNTGFHAWSWESVQETWVLSSSATGDSCKCTHFFSVATPLDHVALLLLAEKSHDLQEIQAVFRVATSLGKCEVMTVRKKLFCCSSCSFIFIFLCSTPQCELSFFL